MVPAVVVAASGFTHVVGAGQGGNVRLSVAGDPAPLLGAPNNPIENFNVGTVVNVNIRIIVTRLSGFFSLGIILPVLVRLPPLTRCVHVFQNSGIRSQSAFMRVARAMGAGGSGEAGNWAKGL